MRRTGTVAALAAAMLMLVALAGPASAGKLAPEPGTLTVSSEFPPFVIVNAGEDFTLTGEDVFCNIDSNTADLRIQSLDEGTMQPNGYVDITLPGQPNFVPFDFVKEITLSTDAVQGTYPLVATCEYPETQFEKIGEPVPSVEDGVTALDGAFEVIPGDVGAEGWLVVGDENRLPPSDGPLSLSKTELVEGEEFEAWGEGYKGDWDLELWMYSDPQLLGTATATATGTAVAQATMPVGTVAGAHTMVFAGVDASGRPLFLTAGVTVGAAAADVVATTTTTVVAAIIDGTTAPTDTTGTTTATGGDTLPRTGGGIGLALPAAGLIGFGWFFGRLARWRERPRSGGATGRA